MLKPHSAPLNLATFVRPVYIDLEQIGGHMLLYDSCCLFLYLVPKLQAEFPGDVVDKHVELFMKGHLGVFGLE